MGAKMCFWMLLLLPVTVVTGPLDETRTETERNQHEDFIRVQSLSGQNRSEREGQVPSEGPDASAPRRLLKDVPCVVEGVHHHPEALHEILLALQNVWSKDGEAKEREFGRFGFCSHDDGVRYSQFSSLMKENKSPEYTHSEKEHLDAEKDGTFTMTLHFAKPATCSEQTTTASIMLLFFIDFCNTEEMKIQFSSQDLQPNNQTACVSQATRFLVLTGIRSNSFGHENIKLRMDVQQDGKKLGLSKFQAITSWRKSRSESPVILLFPKKSVSENVPQSNGARLRTHRVELALKPSLRSVLKLKLDETLAQARMEEFGRGAMDKLEVLSVLSTLSVDGEDLETGLEEQREVQYRALLLLKALQAVLGAWAVERAQRAARDSQDGPTRVTQCHLESFTVSLEKYLLEPATANINNCEGACGFPLNNGNNHAILLNSHLQSGQPLKRGICCVPVAYDDLCVIELNSDSTTISYKTDMIAKECGCR
ncbi:muellerian-inhibiting factor isoform X5 [Tachysurus fulvidraco]|uniref:muellerian-inhibiting factor isoform X5 n=1 Tax=Tachysurus fulvidraco TaxID=1234273 RepID=UPI001FEE6829|nr:muellerian-inhibiting factor isoform X5 [Tachysurus fulvidraco]